MEYLYTNWFEMVKPLNTDYKKQENLEANLSDSPAFCDDEIPPEEEAEVGYSMRHIHALKLYAINCTQWDHLRLNQVSVNLLLLCSLIDSAAKLWVNYLCLEFETLENLSSMMFGSIIVLITIPLFIDLVFILT